MSCKIALITLLTACVTGCMPPPEKDKPKTSQPARVADEDVREEVEEQVEVDGDASTAQTDDNTSTTNEVRVKAETGVGRRGRGYGGGMITEPIKQYFQARQRINFILLEKAIRDYKTLNGRMPSSHDDFMKEIVEANAISLPELPEGQEYIYDPDRKELMVRRPE